MSNAAYVEEAAEYARKLVKLRTKGWGDTPNAIRRVANEARIPPGTVWSLLYRKPKRLWDGVRMNLRDAYLEAQETQLRRLENDIEQTKQKAGAHANSVRSAMALVDTKDG